MNPDLEFFLENALESVPRTALQIGRAVIEPDYDVQPDPADCVPLREEIIRLLKAQVPDPVRLASHDGQEVQIPDAYPLVRKYIRRITLHADRVEGTWIEVV